ncbi:MAG: hypothetical protein HYU71_03595 [Bacteroidetes bacterium]|nr:hypothetical protein [Bacteroidota bacterium]
MFITRFLSGLFCLLLTNNLLGQDTALMTQLLNRIEQLQVKTDGVFPKGSFASYRTYALNQFREKADMNPFYTALIAMTLKDIRPRLSTPQQQVADRIVNHAMPSYHKYENRKGRGTYNFWPTDTPRIFPNGGWMNLFDKRQALPDDMDDTVMVLLAMGAPDSTAREIHRIMQTFTNKSGRHVNNNPKKYRNINAYSTWFGKIMPVEFDICVLSNILYFTQRYDLTWTSVDSASLELIEKVLVSKEHVTSPLYLAPQYGRLPLILYHLARLMSVKKIPSLEVFRSQLIQEAETELRKADHFMDAVILSTALLKWGVTPSFHPVYKAASIEDLVEERPYYFFIANMGSMLPEPYKYLLVQTGIGKFYYDCDAYNNLLLLEYLALKNTLSDLQVGE